LAIVPFSPGGHGQVFRLDSGREAQDDGQEIHAEEARSPA